MTTAATGTITRAPTKGAVIGPGEELVRIDEQPLHLGRGTMPMYRELHLVDSRARDENGERLERLDGPDVTQLQQFLLDAGFDATGGLEADGVFGHATEQAVKAWQDAVGLPVTGRVDNTQLVFHPEGLRIAGDLRVGVSFTALQVDDAQPVVHVDTSNRDRGALPIGIDVDVELPDGVARTGRVTDQEQVTGADGSRVWRTTVAVDGELVGDVSDATVTVVEVVAEDVLTVPVGALLALAEGGFAVEVPADGTTKLVPVEVGEVLDGRAEISGELADGVEVVVPT